MVQTVKDHHLDYPLVAIDGEFKMAGGINFAMIYDEIDSKDSSSVGQEG